MKSDELPPGGTEIGDPPWDPWRPTEIARLVAGVDVPWYVAAGWAQDLALLDKEALGWLETALLRVHPGHAWIEPVRSTRSQADRAARKRPQA